MTDTGDSKIAGIAWLAGGRLFVQRDGQPVREIESTFARETLERRQRSQQLNGWKGRSGIWGQMGMAPPSMEQWEQEQGPAKRPIRFCALARGQHGQELFYVLDCGPVGGLFQYDLERDYEIRLMHREGFVSSDISRHPNTGDVAISLRRSDGSTGVTVGENDGRFLQDMTFSDGIDESPSWVLDGSRRLVFHSATWLRDQHGAARSKTTFRIELLDVDAKSVKTVLEEDGQDLLQPRMLADGTLFFIRRPHRAQKVQRSLWEDVKDVLLFPWRLCLAIVGFLNFFSMMFTGKPLTTSGASRRPPEGHPMMMLWGHMIDTRKALQEQEAGKSQALVPKDWRLIRRTTDGVETVLAENVLSYDLLPSGDVTYTDGSRVFVRTTQGDVKQVANDQLIERVIALSN